ncbi:MAG: helix-turn-helix domain-containing protein [Blautia faecis]
MQNELYIVADAIKALRKQGLTQEQLAEKADISYPIWQNRNTCQTME